MTTNTFFGNTIEGLAERWEELRSEGIKDMLAIENVETEDKLQALIVWTVETAAWKTLAEEKGQFVLEFPTKDQIEEIVSQNRPVNEEVEALSGTLSAMLFEGHEAQEVDISPDEPVQASSGLPPVMLTVVSGSP